MPQCFECRSELDISDVMRGYERCVACRELWRFESVDDSELLRTRGYEIETSIDGVLDAIYAHGKLHFLVFDPISDKGALCIFDEETFDEVMRLMKRRVRVFGTATFNKRHELISLYVTEFERLPDQDEVPRLYDLHAAGISITGDEDSGAYIDRIRDGE